MHSTKSTHNVLQKLFIRRLCWKQLLQIVRLKWPRYLETAFFFSRNLKSTLRVFYAEKEVFMTVPVSPSNVIAGFKHETRSVR